MKKTMILRVEDIELPGDEEKVERKKENTIVRKEVDLNHQVVENEEKMDALLNQEVNLGASPVVDHHIVKGERKEKEEEEVEVDHVPAQSRVPVQSHVPVLVHVVEEDIAVKRKDL